MTSAASAREPTFRIISNWLEGISRNVANRDQPTTQTPTDATIVSVTIVVMLTVQIFGVKNSQASRAAERFFKERRVTIHLVDLKHRPMAPGEIKRFIDRFGFAGLIDAEGKSYAAAGLKYMKLSDSELLGRIERDPQLLRLPLVRASNNKLSIGHDEDSWNAMIAGSPPNR
jgi:arsenate reductase